MATEYDAWSRIFFYSGYHKDNWQNLNIIWLILWYQCEFPDLETYTVVMENKVWLCTLFLRLDTEVFGGKGASCLQPSQTVEGKKGCGGGEREWGREGREGKKEEIQSRCSNINIWEIWVKNIKEFFVLSLQLLYCSFKFSVNLKLCLPHPPIFVRVLLRGRTTLLFCDQS